MKCRECGNKINVKYGKYKYKGFNFNLDATASKKNTKCERFFTKEDNSLIQKWTGNVWCNPPYSVPNVGLFVTKAVYEVNKGNCNLVVMLLPTNTATKWFHKYIYNKHEVRFIEGSVTFCGRSNWFQGHMIVIIKN